VTAKVKDLEEQRDEGTVTKPGQSWTVGKWLLHWLENIAKLSVRYRTYTGYRTAVHKHLIPGVGAHRLHRLEPEHLEKLYARMQANGLKPATAHQVHRTARGAFGEAVKRRRIKVNPAALAKPPRIEEEEVEVEPFEVEEIDQLLNTLLGRRNGTRYVLALSLGLRQGEALGLKWARLDEQTKSLSVRKALQRHTWEHGCDDPHACGSAYHRTTPCKKGCKRHRRACPPPCVPGCTGHARWCPQRRAGGLVEVDVKSKAGRREVGLPDELLALLIEHRKVQDVEREHAESEWHEGGWMFAQPNGKPIDPRRDLAEWKAILIEARVREARLHDARHTAAIVLLLLGVPDRAVMEVMGWSSVAMLKRYQHVTARLRRNIADRLNEFFWKAK
jgi:integrase